MTDDNDKIQYILAQSGFSELKPGFFYSEYNFENCIIPLEAKSGKYKLRLIAKFTGQTDWAIVTNPSVDVVKYVPFEVLEGKESAKLQILSNTPLSVNKSSVNAGEAVTVSFKNFSGILFRGYYGIALTDNGNSIKYILKQSGLSELKSNYYYNEYNFYNCVVPENVIPGNYKLRMISKVEDDVNWVLVDAISSSAIDQIPFEVTNPIQFKTTSDQINVYPNPVVDKLYIQSSMIVTKVILYNMSGTIVLQANESELKNNIVSLGNLSSGIYIAHIYTNQGKTIHTISKK